MTAVLDAPVTAVDMEEMLGIGLLRGAAGESKGDFLGAFPGFLFESCALDEEGLTDLGKVEVVVQRGGRPDHAGFDPSMLGWRLLNEVRFLPVLEIESEVLEQSPLVSFDGEVVMGLSILDQIAGELTLGQ